MSGRIRIGSISTDAPKPVSNSFISPVILRKHVLVSKEAAGLNWWAKMNLNKEPTLETSAS